MLQRALWQNRQRTVQNIRLRASEPRRQGPTRGEFIVKEQLIPKLPGGLYWPWKLAPSNCNDPAVTQWHLQSAVCIDSAAIFAKLYGVAANMEALMRIVLRQDPPLESSGTRLRTHKQDSGAAGYLIQGLRRETTDGARSVLAE
jgi:hypothetical protein